MNVGSRQQRCKDPDWNVLLARLRQNDGQTIINVHAHVKATGSATRAKTIAVSLTHFTESLLDGGLENFALTKGARTPLGGNDRDFTRTPEFIRFDRDPNAANTWRTNLQSALMHVKNYLDSQLP